MNCSGLHKAEKEQRVRMVKVNQVAGEERRSRANGIFHLSKRTEEQAVTGATIKKHILQHCLHTLFKIAIQIHIVHYNETTYNHNRQW